MIYSSDVRDFSDAIGNNCLKVCCGVQRGEMLRAAAGATGQPAIVPRYMLPLSNSLTAMQSLDR